MKKVDAMNDKKKTFGKLILQLEDYQREVFDRDSPNKHSFNSNGHDKKIFNDFCKVSSQLDTYSLLEFIVENWCDVQDLEDITNNLINKIK